MRSPNCQGVSPTPDDDDLTATASAPTPTFTMAGPTQTPTHTLTPTTLPTVTYGSCQVTTTIADLKLRLSPTRNSPQLITIPLGIQLNAQYRLEVTSTEIWYQVDYQGVQGWIAATITGIDNVDITNCELPLPYPDTWPSIAQITSNEIPGDCNIDAYLISEPTALVLARIAYGEAGVYKPVPIPGVQASSGGIVFEDAKRIAWIIRMDAFLGLANYGTTGFTGRSVPIVEQILAGINFEPITDLRTLLNNNGCNPQAISDSFGNVRKMVYPRNTPSAPNPGSVEIYELWLVYQQVSENIVNAPWGNMPIDIRGFDQFKGILNDRLSCSDALQIDEYTRPGTGYNWASNQPYPPQPMIFFPEPTYGGANGEYQQNLTCYQDIYQLDDWFWHIGIHQLSDPATNTFPREFCLKTLINPEIENDSYPLEQLRGADGVNYFPPGIPDFPSCTLVP